MLTYRYHEEYEKKLISKTFEDLPYFSKQKMKTMYPKGGYIVVGAIGQGVSENAGLFQYNDVMMQYYTLHFNKLAYTIDGYIDCGENQYIAVVKNVIWRNGIFAICGLLMVVVMMYGIYASSPNSGMDPNAKSYTPKIDTAVVVDPDHIALPGYDDIRMEAGSDIAYMALWNPEGNPCVFKFSLLQEGEVLYESGFIQPGMAVTEVKLNKKVEKGVHNATLKIQTFALDDTDIELNGGEVLIKLIGLEKSDS